MANRREGRPSEHIVYGLLDAKGNLGWVGWRNTTRPAAWRAIWTVRHTIRGSRLASWMGSLDAEPVETIILGGAARLNRQEAGVIAAVLAGLLKPAVPAPQPQKRMAVGIVGKDGTLKWWSSQAEACRSLGLTRYAVYHRLHSGGMVRIP